MNRVKVFFFFFFFFIVVTVYCDSITKCNDAVSYCFTMFIYSFVIEIVYVRHVTFHVMFVFVLYAHGPNGLMLNKISFCHQSNS